MLFRRLIISAHRGLPRVEGPAINSTEAAEARVISQRERISASVVCHTCTMYLKDAMVKGRRDQTRRSARESLARTGGIVGVVSASADRQPRRQPYQPFLGSHIFFGGSNTLRLENDRVHIHFSVIAAAKTLEQGHLRICPCIRHCPSGYTADPIATDAIWGQRLSTRRIPGDAGQQ